MAGRRKRKYDSRFPKTGRQKNGVLPVGFCGAFGLFKERKAGEIFRRRFGLFESMCKKRNQRQSGCKARATLLENLTAKGKTKMILKADLHVHSAASPDGRSTVEQIVRQAEQIGLDAVAVCDHDRCTPLPEGDTVCLISAAEITTTAGHLLGLFLESPIDISALRSDEGLADPERAVRVIHEHGGLAVWAHPYAPQKAEDDVLVSLPADGIETQNARAPLKNKEANRLACRLAERRRLVQTGGSDAHHISELGSCYTEIECENRSVSAMRQAVAEAHCRAVFVRRCSRIQKALSQLKKARRLGGVRRFCKAILYLGYSVFLEILGK